MSRFAVTERSAELVAAGVPHVRATVVRAEHPTSVHAGDAAVVHADGTIEGFVGGTCAESSVQVHARAALDTGEPLLLRILPGGARGRGSDPAGGDPQEGPSSEHGAVTVSNPCLSGGAVEIFLEPLAPPAHVVVVGDTPIARALVDLAAPLGFAVEATTDAIEVGAEVAAVIVASHGRGEEQALAAALAADVPYVALVASRRRGSGVLAALDLDDEALARVSVPAGLDIGARTAPEIALSILAELVERRRSRPTGVAEGGATPVSEGGVAPVSEGGVAPVSEGGAGPVSEGGVAPVSEGGAGPVSEGGVAPPTTAVDPICGMTVLVTPDTVRATVDGDTAWFCCTGCRDSWLAAEG